MRFLIPLLIAMWPISVRAQVECTVNHVDAQASTVSLEKNKQVGIFHVLPTSEILVSGSRASLSDLEPGMHARLTTTNDPGTIKWLEVSKKAATPTPSPKATGFTDKPITQSQSVTIAASDADGYRINDVKKGASLSFQYLDGKWKEHGHIAEFNPDDAKTPDNSKLVIALPRTGGGLGSVLATVSPSTAKRRFVFTADKDYAALVLRINAEPSANPGKVEYKVTLVPAPH